MRILFVTRPIAPPWNEGNKNSVLELARAMHGHKVHILTAKGFFCSERHIVSEQIFSRSGLVSGLSLQQKARLFLRLVFGKRVDIYHFFFKPTPVVSLFARLAMRLRGGISVQTVVSAPKKGELLAQSIFSENVVAGSRFMQNCLLKEGINSEHISFGVDSKKFVSNPIAAKKALGLERVPMVLFAGHLHSFSGLDTVVGSMGKVLRSFPKAKFVFACRDLGTVSERMNLERAKIDVREQGLEANAVFLGAVANMKQLVDAADIVVFPPNSMEYKLDYPLVVLEAMAFGKPVVISNLAPLNELFEEGANLLVGVNDSNALSSAISKLLSSDETRSVMGQRAKKLVARKFNSANAVKEYLALYTRILEEAGRAKP